MRTYRLYDFANPISVAITNPSQSGYSRFVGLEHYDSGELVVKRYSGTELLTTTAKAFEKNDILIARRNVYLKRAGIVFFDGITSGDSIVLRIKEDCKSITGVPKELAQRIVPIVLNSEQFWKYANKHADGMNSKRISKEMLLAYEFELPSLEEQRVLADKLWAAYRKVIRTFLLRPINCYTHNSTKCLEMKLNIARLQMCLLFKWEKLRLAIYQHILEMKVIHGFLLRI